MPPRPMDMAPATTAAVPPPSPSLDAHQDTLLHGTEEEAMAEEDEEEDEAECRVCRGEAEPERRLFAPCRCSGSIRFTHSDCLEQWLEHSGKSYCELCGYKFAFKPLYDAAAPAVLPWSELLSTVATMALYKWLPFVVRGVLVVVLWLGVAPWCTSWLYRMWLLRASAMVNVNFSERLDHEHVTADIFSGMLLIVGIIVSFLSLMSFADFLRFHLDHLGEPLDDDDHHHNHHHAHHHANVGPGLGAAGGQRGDERPPLFFAPEPVMAEAQDRDDREGDEPARPFPGVFARHPREELGLPAVQADVRPAEEDMLVDERRPEQELRQRRPLGGRVPDQNDQNDPPPAPRHVAVPPPHPPRPQNANNNNRDGWEDDFEHMEINIAMDELLGLRGDFVVLFRNVSWLLAFNGAYLGLFAFIPYTLGSTILSAGVKIYSSLPIAPVIAGWFADDPRVMADELSVGMFVVRTLLTAMTNAKKNGDCLQLVDLSTCFVGYVSICFTIVLWRWMVATASPFMNRPLMGGAIWALRCLTAIVKVSTLLLLKMVALPVTLGIGINSATLRLFDVTVHERITFFVHNMVGSLLVHWVLGITFMLFITVSVLQLREVMHPDILAKVIRPQEAHPDLLRSLMSETCVKHARRMLLSLVIYAALLVLLVHVPIRLVNAVAPDLFPLHFRFQHYVAEIQVPIELLITHLIVLGILEQSKNAIGGCQYLGVHFFCSKLGLTEYLLPRVTVDWDSRTTPRGSEVVLAPPPLHFHPQAAAPPHELKINGLRYLPWPEDGLEDPPPDAMEYVLLRRQVPTKLLHARVATLVVAIWLVLVTVMGALILGSFFLGRACLAPLERLTGITHDPLALAAGVQIVWYLVNGMNALNMLTLPEIQVERELLDRGYGVKNMTPDNAIMCVVGWACLAPFFVGFLLAACVPSTKATGFESFWLGYLIFNLAAWFVCCFRLKKTRRRRRRRAQPERVVDEDEFNEDDLLDDLLDEDDLDLDVDVDLDLDLDDEFLDEDEAEQRRGNEDEARAHVEEEPVPADVQVDGVLAALRKCYKQVLFSIHVHDNDAVRLRNDPLGDRCFDVTFFLERVLLPVLATLTFFILVCTLQSWVLLFLWSSPTLKETAFALSATGWGLLLTIVRGSPLLAQWTTTFAESIRNERYLIGRELQDMAR